MRQTTHGGRGVRHAGDLAAVVLFLHALTACGAPEARRPFTHTFESPQALAREVLDALHLKDRAQLEALALTEHEFRHGVWPELPAARPERNLSFAYVWNDLRVKSSAALHRTLETHGGRSYELVSLRFSGETTPYRTYRVHRKAVLTVRRSDGATEDARLFGSVVEQNGRFKVFSYVVD